MILNNITIYKNEFKTSDTQPDYRAYGCTKEFIGEKYEYTNKAKIGAAWKKENDKDGKKTTFISLELTGKNNKYTNRENVEVEDKAYVIILKDEYEQLVKASKSTVQPAGYTGEVANIDDLEF